jgi:hypothetical protein
MRRPALLVALLAAVVALLVLLLWPRPAPSPAAAHHPDVPATSTAAPPAALPAGLPTSAAPADDAPAPRGAFEGNVRSAGTGAGLPGAELTFSRGGAAATVRTGPDGAFRFEPPEAGRWQLATATAPGHEPFAPEWGHSSVAFEARPGERVRGATLWLRPVRPYAGIVLDHEGKPVEGAAVRVAGSSTGDRALLPSAEGATSRSDGTFEIAAPDGATLEARRAGFAPGRAALDAAARSGRRVVVKLGEAGTREAGAISGHVLFAGAPVEGALVTARLLTRGGPGSAEEGVAAQATSDAAGRYSLPGLDPGRYLLGAAREGYTQARATVARPGEEATIELARGGRVTGTVTAGSPGRPVSPFRVEVRRGGRGWRLALRGVTVLDASGRFEIGDLPAGPLSVSASAAGHLPSPEVEVTVPEGGAAEVELRLGTGGRVAGRVVDRTSGRPLAGARATLEGDGASAPSLLDAGASAITGPDGTFLVTGVPARTVSLLVEADGHHSRIVTGLEVPEGGQAGPVEVKLSPLAEGEEPRVELAGIGATLERRGRAALRITFVAPGGGAAEAGLVAGDEILQVEGRPVADLGLSGAVDLIRGPEDTRVRLVVRRGEAPPGEVLVWRRLVRG